MDASAAKPKAKTKESGKADKLKADEDAEDDEDEEDEEDEEEDDSEEVSDEDEVCRKFHIIFLINQHLPLWHSCSWYLCYTREHYSSMFSWFFRHIKEELELKALRIIF